MENTNKLQNSKHNAIALYRVYVKANTNIWRLLFPIVKLVNDGNRVDGIKLKTT